MGSMTTGSCHEHPQVTGHLPHSPVDWVLNHLVSPVTKVHSFITSHGVRGLGGLLGREGVCGLFSVCRYCSSTERIKLEEEI